MSSDVRDFIRRGTYLLDLKRPGDAIKEFEQALAVAPEDADVLCYMALSFTMLKDPDRAQQYLSRAIVANPNNEWAFRIKALAHLQRDQRTSAYKAATRALQLDPENIECMTMLARCAICIQREEEAKMLAEMLLRQAPESTNGHLILGEVAVIRSELGDAAAHYEKVLELDSTNADALESLAGIRNAHNKYGESVSLLRGALSIDPTQQQRQSSFHDSLKRFSLFGEAYARRKSVAGLLVVMFLAYLSLGVVGYRVFAPGAWFGSAFLGGLAVLVLLGIPFLRGRFFASQSAQLHMLYQNFSRTQRKRTLLALAVGVVAAYGIAALVYRDNRDPKVFLTPISIAVTGLWIYMLAITFRLATLWLSDTWSKMSRREVPQNERGVSFIMAALPTSTVVALGVGLWNGHPMAWLLCLIGIVLSTILYYRHFPLPTGIAVVAVGLVLVVIDWGTPVSASELTLGQFGGIVAALGLILLACVGNRIFRQFWQRRRIRRVLGSVKAEPDLAD